MNYNPTDASEKALEAPIVAEMTRRTGCDMSHVGEVREYMPYGGSADMSTAQAGEAQKNWSSHGRM